MTRYDKLVALLKENDVDFIYVSDDFDKDSECPNGTVLIPSDAEDIAVDATYIYLDGQEEECEESNLMILAYPEGSQSLENMIEAYDLSICQI